MSELKNCPFCGSENIKEEETDFTTRVVCDDCWCQSHSSEKWNLRVIQWVPVAEKLPKDDAKHYCKLYGSWIEYWPCYYSGADKTWYEVYNDGYFEKTDCVIFWQDDHTWDKDEK
jgi:hypothetical protein